MDLYKSISFFKQHVPSSLNKVSDNQLLPLVKVVWVFAYEVLSQHSKHESLSESNELANQGEN